MLLAVLWLVSFLFFTCVGLLFFYHMYRDKLIMLRRVTPLLTPRTVENQQKDEDDNKNKTLYERLIFPLLAKIRTFVEGKLPKHKVQQIEKKLQAAGNPFGFSAGEFILIQTILPIIIFLLLTLLFVPTADNKGKVLALAVMGAVFAYIYTNNLLSTKSKQRVKEIEKAMPDFFDMLNVSIEAGLGLDGALKKVCTQMDSALSNEFLYALEDMKLGKTRKQAFTEIKNRVPSEFLSSVLNSIIQADQMGIGMSKVLRTQTARIREKHRFHAKEQAMKAPVKMLIPMVIFIFPTLFIVLLGPVVINLVTQLF